MTGHQHGAGHYSAWGTSSAAAHRGRLTGVLVITGVAVVAEMVGGLLSGSLALLADAGHLVTDVVGTTVALGAIVVANRPAPARRSYGNFRAEILAVLANGVLLLMVCAVVGVEGVRRLAHPDPVQVTPMLVIGVLGLAANGAGAYLLRHGQALSLTVRGAYLEVLGDLVGSVLVVIAALVITVSSWQRADAVASILIAVIIAPRAIALLRDAVHVLAEGTPPGVDLDALRRHIADVPGVVDVHDLHVWAITSGMPVLSAHVVVDDALATAGCGTGSVLDQLTACVGDHFDVEHSTFQVEAAGHDAHEHAAHD